jgi:hypothetical protein
MSFKKLCQQLETKIQAAYTGGVTLSDAELLAAEFLRAQMKVSEELKVADLDSRMRKSGVKAIRAAVYMEAATKTDKKPSDSMLEAITNMSKVVQDSQDGLDKAEAEKDELTRYYNIFRESHIYFRGISKGKFE